jgi:fumarate reductase flavoprotein subunit
MRDEHLLMADVLVVGGGAPGLAAAVEAAAAGATVRVLDAGTKVGGSLGMSAGVFSAAGTRVQRAAGVEESPDASPRTT